MMERTFVGLDVHARTTVAGVLDAVTGEVRSFRAPTLSAKDAAAPLFKDAESYP